MTNEPDNLKTREGIAEVVKHIPQKWDNPPAWKLSEKGKEAVKVAQSMVSTNHGLYASIPLVCKDDNCSYADTCPLKLYGLSPEGERCPMEIAQLEQLYNRYASELDVDENSEVDRSLLKELIDIEITMDRANAILSRDGSFIQDVAVGVSENGQPITRPEIHKAQEIKDKLSKRKITIMKELNSTRKDKAQEKRFEGVDPSSFAANLMAKGLEKKKEEENTIEVTPEKEQE